MSSVSIPETLAIRFASVCDVGELREERKGTSKHCSTPLGDLLTVADGIGNDVPSRRASQIAVETISSSIERSPFFPPEIALELAIIYANAAILAAAAQSDLRGTRMGSTVIVALLRRDDDHADAHVQAIIGRIGNTRAYLVHKQKLTLVTESDTAEQGLIDCDKNLPEPQKTHPNASMLAAYLGKELNARPEMCRVELKPATRCCSALRVFASPSRGRRLRAHCPIRVTQ